MHLYTRNNQFRLIVVCFIEIVLTSLALVFVGLRAVIFTLSQMVVGLMLSNAVGSGTIICHIPFRLIVACTALSLCLKCGPCR
jgi:hypothetical protein